MWMNFAQDATAKIEGLLAVNRDFCRQQIAQNSPQISLPNCAVLPIKKHNAKQRHNHLIWRHNRKTARMGQTMDAAQSCGIVYGIALRKC